MLRKQIISLEEASKIIADEESHFLDFKSKDISGSKLQKSAVAFANADGGEILVGIEDPRASGRASIDRWNGFNVQEEANPLIQTISQDITPYPPVEFEFYEVDMLRKKGLVLKINVAKSSSVHTTSDNQVYERKNAQNLPIIGDSIVNLKLSKGLISYEDQLISGFTVDELAEQAALTTFLEGYSPRTDPLDFLIKQRLIRKEGSNYLPTLAGVLLYADNPSTIISKKCAVKINRYDTSDPEPLREHLKQQFTIEGPSIEQINESLRHIQVIIESISILGEKGLEKPKYPTEAIKEILVNALIHRDYNISDDIQVFIYNNRIEVKSPGRLPGHITINNILDQRFARNPAIVRLLNKYPDPPNKDIGEGLNTAFQRMQEMRLKSPIIKIADNMVIVTLPHEPLASPEETVLEYLNLHEDINNRTARRITGIRSENSMKDVFYRLRDRNLVEKCPGRNGPASSWRRKR
jgi:ATP-dependent DNA helicase RecG